MTAGAGRDGDSPTQKAQDACYNVGKQIRRYIVRSSLFLRANYGLPYHRHLNELLLGYRRALLSAPSPSLHVPPRDDDDQSREERLLRSTGMFIMEPWPPCRSARGSKVSLRLMQAPDLWRRTRNTSHRSGGRLQPAEKTDGLAKVDGAMKQAGYPMAASTVLVSVQNQGWSAACIRPHLPPSPSVIVARIHV